MSEYTRRQVVRHSVAAVAALTFLPAVPGISRGAARKQVYNAETEQALTWSLDVNGFFASMKAGLAGANGYSMELRRHGVTVQSYSAGNAIALTRLLAQTGISPDDPISPHLPGYWTPGPDVELITFANLMTQTSGLTDPSGGQNYAAARQAIEAGVTDASSIGASGQLSEATWDYQNINFDLCRILMATISGTVGVGYLDHNLLHPQVTLIDQAWDALT